MSTAAATPDFKIDDYEDRIEITLLTERAVFWVRGNTCLRINDGKVCLIPEDVRPLIERMTVSGLTTIV